MLNISSDGGSTPTLEQTLNCFLETVAQELKAIVVPLVEMYTNLLTS